MALRMSFTTSRPNEVREEEVSVPLQLEAPEKVRKEPEEMEGAVMVAVGDFRATLEEGEIRDQAVMQAKNILRTTRTKVKSKNQSGRTISYV